MTWNIHHARGLDGEVDIDRIAAEIRAAAPDLVALQEVDRGVRRTGGLDIPAALAERTGMQ
ncbi:MAG: endonuclease/exonuclease/phosphatase family metal-dependent hydrolase, partial [Planctomycetota bacterium]